MNGFRCWSDCHKDREAMFEGPKKQFQKHIADLLGCEHAGTAGSVDYGGDTREEIFKTLREEIRHRQLWSIIRTGCGYAGMILRFDCMAVMTAEPP